MISNKVAIPLCILSIVIILCCGWIVFNKGGSANKTNDKGMGVPVVQTGRPLSEIPAMEFVDRLKIGWNLGNSLDAHYGDRTGDANLKQETVWGNIRIEKELLEYVAEAGFDFVRIPVSWYYHTYTDEEGHLHICDEWLERVKQVVDYALDSGMYVVLNSHHDQPIFYAGTDDESMKQVLFDIKDIWKEIATYFADYDERLVFEGFNEIDNVAQSWMYSDLAAKQMNQMNQCFVDTVRKCEGYNKNRFLMVPTLLDGSHDKYLNAFTLPKDKKKEKLIIQVHDYSQGFAQDLEPLFERLGRFSQKHNTPVIIGEFGTKPDFEPEGKRAVHAANYVARAKKHGIRCIYWDDGNLGNYGLVERKFLQASETQIINALMNPKENVNETMRIYNSMEQFVYMTLNQGTGELKEDPYWGTIVFNGERYGSKVPEDAKQISLTLATGGEATSCRIHYLHFYDEDGKLLDAVNDGNGFFTKTMDIPTGACYFRVGINNSHQATKEKKYNEYFDEGKLSLMVSWIQ